MIFTMVIELSREQFHTMILHDGKIGLNYRTSHVRLVVVWGEGRKHSLIEQFLTDFYEYEYGKLDVSDSSRSGRSHTAVTDEMIDTVRD